MGEFGDRYIVGEEYRNAINTAENEYWKWLNAATEGGITPQRGISALENSGSEIPEFLVLYSTGAASRSGNPWEDLINMEDGVARYWGDSKAGDGPDPLGRDGNKLVKEIYCKTYARNDRSSAPPVLLFERERPGWVTFRGVCIISGLEIARHRDEGEVVVNYRIDLDILDADVVELEWIHRKTRTGIDTGGPDAWHHWVETGTVDRYSIYSDRIRSTRDQTPEGQLETLHTDIRSRLDGSLRERGEKLELLLQRLLAGMDNVSDVSATPTSGDLGVDLTGQIDLFPDAQLEGPDTWIDFKAQVKNKQDSVGGRELSRIASRIEDGEIGLFFTMSYYTAGAQKENLSTYPIRLFAGRDIAGLLAQSDLASGGRLNDRVVAEINEAV